jgi:aminoglycoside N3'-acetyltransferase
MGASGVTAIETLTGQLRILGVRPGDILMPHMALRDLVPVERGPGGVLAALRASVGPKGTLLFAIPCETAGSVFRAEDRGRVAGKLATTFGFDPRRARPRGVLGDFPQAVLDAADVEIAPHPAMRYAAFGRRARKLLDRMADDDPMGIGSPVDRLTALGGKILVAGADPWLVTAAHLAEYHAKPRGRLRIARHYRTNENGAVTFRTVHMIDDTNSELRHDRAFEGARTRRFARVGTLGRGEAVL